MPFVPRKFTQTEGVDNRLLLVRDCNGVGSYYQHQVSYGSQVLYHNQGFQTAQPGTTIHTTKVGVKSYFTYLDVNTLNIDHHCSTGSSVPTGIPYYIPTLFQLHALDIVMVRLRCPDTAVHLGVLMDFVAKHQMPNLPSDDVYGARHRSVLVSCMSLKTYMDRTKHFQKNSKRLLFILICLLTSIFS